MEFERPRLLISRQLEAETEGVSPTAKRMLITLMAMGARSGTTEIPVSSGNVAPYLRNASDKEAFPTLFAELCLRGLVRQVRPGIYSIAPGLWKAAVWDPVDAEYYPYSDAPRTSPPDPLG
jgi:hypothetical protein